MNEILKKNKQDFWVRPNDIFFSDRDCPLVTQNLFGGTKLITVERYLKWYNLFLLDPDAKQLRDESIVKIIPSDKEGSILTWKQADEICPFYGLQGSHVFYPVDVVNVAIYLGAKLELQVYDAICRRFLQDDTGTENIFTEEFFKEVNTRRMFIKHPNEMVDLLYGVDYNVFPTDVNLKKVLLDDDALLIN